MVCGVEQDDVMRTDCGVRVWEGEGRHSLLGEKHVCFSCGVIDGWFSGAVSGRDQMRII